MHGLDFLTPSEISNGSRLVVAYGGALYVIFEGTTRLSTPDSAYIVKSTNGGVTFSKPVKVAELQDVISLANTAFRVNSFPAGAAAPNSDLYVAWSTLMGNAGGLCPTETNSNCHSSTVYSKSTNGGATWTAPFPALDASNRTAISYPAPNGLATPAARRVDTLWPGVAVSPSGVVYMSAYAADTVSPWQVCASGPVPPEGRINCSTLGLHPQCAPQLLRYPCGLRWRADGQRQPDQHP